MDKRRFIAVDAKLVDTLVGAAIRGVVRGGADDAYVAEFSAAYRTQVEQLLGVAQQPLPSQPPELLDLVTQAVERALERAGVPPADAVRRSSEMLPSESASRINVKVNGKRTSLTIKASLLARAQAQLGGRRKTVAAIADLAASAPESTANRSGWVQDRLHSLLQGAEMGVAH